MSADRALGKASYSGRAPEGPDERPWWAVLGNRLADTRIQLRIGCNTPAGQLWISVPLHRGRQRCTARSTGAGRSAAATASLGLSRLPLWQQSLLHRLLSDSEVQTQLQRADLTLGEDTVARWAKAKHGNSAVAEEALRLHIAWRADNVPGGEIHEDTISNALADQKVFLQGCDHRGRAVIILIGQRHFTAGRDLGETIRFISYVLDNAIAATDPVKNPAGRILCLLDLDGVRMRNIDVAALRAIFDLVQNHYPEHLDMMWFLNAPFIFRGAWKGISPFIAPATKEKLEFLSGGQGRTVLQSHISLEVLPEAYGGLAQLVPVEAAVARLRQRSRAMSARSRPLTEAAPEFARGRAAAAGRAVKRWAGSSWGFVKRHAPSKSWFAKGNTAPGPPGRIRTSFSHMGRALSTRLSATPRSLDSPRASSLLRGLSKLTPAVVATLVVVALRTLSHGAAQALHWAWDHMPGRQSSAQSMQQPAPSQLLRLGELHSVQEVPSQPCDEGPGAFSEPASQLSNIKAVATSPADANHSNVGHLQKRVGQFRRAEGGNFGNDLQASQDGWQGLHVSPEVQRRAAALDASQLLKGSFGIGTD